MTKFYAEAFYVHNMKERAKLGSDGSLPINLKTVKGAVNRAKSVKWPNGTTRVDIVTYVNYYDDSTRKVHASMDASHFETHGG